MKYNYVIRVNKGAAPMPATFGLREYHLRFINKYYKLCKEQYAQLDDLRERRNAMWYLLPPYNKIYEKLGIILRDYPIEYIKKTYNINLDLYYKVEEVYEANKDKLDATTANALKNIKQYCNILADIYSLEHSARYYADICKLDFDNFCFMVTNFFKVVNYHCINGEGYRMGNHLGVFYLVKTLTKKPYKVLNVQATRKAKEIEEGGTPFDPASAYMADLLNIEYHGEKVNVYYEKNSNIRGRIAPTTLYGDDMPILELSTGLHKKLADRTKPRSYEYEKVETDADIYNASWDLGPKVILMDRLFPNITLQLIRLENPYEITPSFNVANNKHRTNYSED